MSARTALRGATITTATWALLALGSSGCGRGETAGAARGARLAAELGPAPVVESQPARQAG